MQILRMSLNWPGFLPLPIFEYSAQASCRLSAAAISGLSAPRGGAEGPERVLQRRLPGGSDPIRLGIGGSARTAAGPGSWWRLHPPMGCLAAITLARCRQAGAPVQLAATATAPATATATMAMGVIVSGMSEADGGGSRVLAARAIPQCPTRRRWQWALSQCWARQRWGKRWEWWRWQWWRWQWGW